jgi:1,4-dihydroxy-6-naphthoate synthase
MEIMTTELTIGYSPCPNDTFIFYALTQGKVRVPGVTFRERLEDVETLNRLAIDSALDITKVSVHALGHLRQHYALLRHKNRRSAAGACSCSRQSHNRVSAAAAL